MKALILAPFSPEALDRLKARLGVIYQSWLETRRLISPEEMRERIEVVEVSGLGTGLCAAVGAGVYSSLEEAIEAMVPPPRMVGPHRKHNAEYEELYQKWLTTSRRLEELSQEI